MQEEKALDQKSFIKVELDASEAENYDSRLQ
jgi:hypothetical protein